MTGLGLIGLPRFRVNGLRVLVRVEGWGARGPAWIPVKALGRRHASGFSGFQKLLQHVDLGASSSTLHCISPIYP